MTCKDKIENTLKSVHIAYAIILFIFGICQYSQENYGLKKTDLGDFDKAFIICCAGYIAFVVIQGLVVFQIQKSYQERVEEDLERLFPHSNIKGYKKEIGLPVTNRIHT